MTTHRCGCSVAPDPASGVLRSVAKCPKHRRAYRDPKTLGEDYYAAFGVVKGGRPAPTAHVAELREALGDFPRAAAHKAALEIGCGASPYVGAVRAAGYTYAGVDASPWVAEWMARAHGAPVLAVPVEEAWGERAVWGLILAAHVLEHLDDAPGAITRMAGMLAPGGELWVVVPDDSDQVNPDHLFFFNEYTLKYCIESAGLSVVRMAVRKYVEHENFIYARARKPC